MLTKEDVITHLTALDLDPSRYWITAGAALLFLRAAADHR